MRFFVVFSLVLFLQSCASLVSLKDPEVSLIGIEPVKSSGMTPRFVLHLMITNPNDIDLDIDGVAFNFSIAEEELLSGVANNIPTLTAYGETAVDVQGSISLFKLFNLFRGLGKDADKALDYKLTTTIDPSGFPAFDVEQVGNLSGELKKGLQKAGLK